MMSFFFSGPPIVCAIILSIILNIPFRFIDFPSRPFRIYWGTRFTLALGGLFGPLIFRVTGGYESIRQANEFSPIGTDEHGMAVIWTTMGAIVFGVISLFELSYVLGKRLNQ